MKWQLAVFLSTAQLIACSPLQQEVLKIETELEDVRKELVKADIIPSVISNFDPKYLLEVTWPSKKAAKLGNTILPDHVQDEPSVKLVKTDSLVLSDMGSSSTTYTVAMTDPDAPSRADPKWSEICHWIVTKVAFGGPASLGSSQKDIMPYKPPGPPEKTGFHRYILLAFEPKNGTTEKLHLSKPEDRKHWGTGKTRHGVKDWADANELVPVAANFIYVQNSKQ